MNLTVKKEDLVKNIYRTFIASQAGVDIISKRISIQTIINAKGFPVSKFIVTIDKEEFEASNIDDAMEIYNKMENITE